MTNERTLIVQNTPAPYRRPLFEEIGSHLPLDVAYCKPEQDGRNWDIEGTPENYSEVLLWYMRFFFVWSPGILPLLLRNRYDCVVVGANFSTLPTTIACALYCTVSRANFVVWLEPIETEHTRSTNHSLAVAAARVLRGFIYRRASCVMALSENAKSYALQCGVPPEEITVVDQTYPETLLETEELSKPACIDTEKTTYLSLCYLRPEKGIDVLLEAYKRIATENTQLIVAGDGPERETLESMAGTRPDIYFSGYVDRTDRYYRYADVFVLPTLHDPWGLVVNEALYHGLPVVTTTAAGASRLVDDDLVVPPNDVGAIADTLSTLRDDMTREHYLPDDALSADAVDTETMANTIVRVIRGPSDS